MANPELLWPQAVAEPGSAWTGQSPVTTRAGYSKVNRLQGQGGPMA